MNVPVTLPIGGKINTDLAITPVRIAVLTISDTRDEESDTSGHTLAERVKAAGHIVAEKDIVKDDISEIRARVKSWTKSGEIDAIITTGGTGITGRDVTPEAIEPLLDKKIDGFSVTPQLDWIAPAVGTPDTSCLVPRTCDNTSSIRVECRCPDNALVPA